MLNDFILEKSKGKSLSQNDYFEIVDYILKNGADKDISKLFLSLNSFGMNKEEVLSLALALRDSGRVLRFENTILEKHSTGGIADSTSIVLIPLLASLGYKVIKTTAKSFMFTNGGADRFGAIPGFSTKLTDKEIQQCLYKTNACVLSHDGDMCPADKIVADLRIELGIEDDINMMAASIAAKKLASGAGVVLVDVKYGPASLIPTYSKAIKMANILKYVFKKCRVKSVIAITATNQTIGEGVGNAIEVVDALNVLQGKKCKLRDVSVKFATEMILKANPYIAKKDLVKMIEMTLDNGVAYKRFLEIVKLQGGDVNIVAEAKLFKPYKSINFISKQDGYVGHINSLLLGELIRRLCQENHDNNIGAVLRVKLGDFVRVGDVILSLYYKNDEDLKKYSEAISGCVRLTKTPIKPQNVIKRIIR